MSLQVTSESTTKDASGYRQNASDTKRAQSGAKKKSSSNDKSVSNETSSSTNARNLISTGTSNRSSISSVHLGFDLSFELEIRDREPFDPNHKC